MTQRINVAFLEARVDTVNRMLGYPVPTPYGTEGAVTLSRSYGGYAVHQWNGPHGGVSSLTAGHGPARETAGFLGGMIAALRAAEKANILVSPEQRKWSALPSTPVPPVERS